MSFLVTGGDGYEHYYYYTEYGGHYVVYNTRDGDRIGRCDTIEEAHELATIDA